MLRIFEMFLDQRHENDVNRTTYSSGLRFFGLVRPGFSIVELSGTVMRPMPLVIRKAVMVSVTQTLQSAG